MATSDTVILYRIEHKETNVGPFQTRDPFLQKMADFLSMPYNLRQFPSQWDDGIVLSSVPWFWVFGCEDLTTLMKWVSLGSTFEENTQIYLALQERGFVIRRFLVPDTDCRRSRSGMQTIFNADDARKEEMFEEMEFSDYIRTEGVRMQAFGHLQFSSFDSKQLETA